MVIQWNTSLIKVQTLPIIPSPVHWILNTFLCAVILWNEEEKIPFPFSPVARWSSVPGLADVVFNPNKQIKSGLFFDKQSA